MTIDDDFYFIHISDTHMTPPHSGLYTGDDAEHNFRRVIEAARNLDVAPAFFVISGDLSDRGEVASYVRLACLVAEVEEEGTPVLLALGNHDDRANFYSVFHQGYDTVRQPSYHYSRTIGELRVIVLDSLVEGCGHGLLGSEQLEWLDNELSRPEPRMGTVIVLHHPPVNTGATWVDDLKLADSDALLEVLDRHNVQCVLNGHTHYPSVNRFGSTISATAPGVANLVDPSSRNGLRYACGAGFNLVSIRNGELSVHPVILPGPRYVIKYENDIAVAQSEETSRASQSNTARKELAVT